MNNFLEEKLLPIANKIAQNKFLSAVRDGVSISIPFSIIGAFALIVGCFPVDAWTTLIEPYSSMIFCFSTVTLDALGIIALLGIGYNMGVQYGVDPITNTAITLVTFFLATLTEDGAIDTSVFGAGGMFCAIIVGFVVTLIYKFFVDKKIVIKLPDGVPPAIANSFVSLLPALGAMLVAWFVRVVLGIDVNAVISALFSPLVKRYELSTWLRSIPLPRLLTMGMWYSW